MNRQTPKAIGWAAAQRGRLDDLRAIAADGGLIYLASPYSGYARGIHAAYDDVLDVVVALQREGIPVFSPIVHWHPVAQRADLPKDADFWWSVNSTHLKYADALVVAKLPGWSDSAGILMEVAQFRARGRFPFFLEIADEFTSEEEGA